MLRVLLVSAPVRGLCLVPTETYPQRHGEILHHVTLWATKPEAQYAVRGRRGLRGWRTAVNRRIVRTDGALLIVWVATIWKREA